MEFIENKTYDEIKVGDAAELMHTITMREIQLFAMISGDVNPAHLDEEFARQEIFHKIIAHGMWTGSLISAVLGTKLPGPGTIYLGQTFKFTKPVMVGDTIVAKVKVIEKKDDKKIVVLDCECLNKEGKKVLSGQAEVIAPTEKVRRRKIELPNIQMKKPSDEYYIHIMQLAKNMRPLKTAIVHAVDTISVEGAYESAKENLIEPIFVGPKSEILKIAEKLKIDLSPYEIIDTKGEHDSTLISIDLAKDKKVEALMKGKLHTDDLMRAIVNCKELRTGRKMSHVFVLDIPSYHKPLYLTDTALNIAPNLSTKKDIVQNVIDLFKAVEHREPKIAIVTATESINQDIKSTLDAAALCKMWERGQIVGGIMDGPLAFDNTVSKAAAVAKGIESEVVGDADIVVVPDLESGNLMLKQLSYLSGAEGAGLVLGSKIPIILTSRASLTLTRKLSCAFSLLYVRNTKG